MKNRKMFFTLIAFLSILLLSGSIIFASTKFFPEPRKTKDVPSGVMWDTTLGCYISNDVLVDSSTGNLVERDSKTRSSSELKTDIVNPLDQWNSTHRNSSSEVDKALIQYSEESKKHINIKNYYDPKDDKALSILVDLGVKNLPEMVNKIESNDYWAGTLMYAVEEITKTNNGHISVYDDDRLSWAKKIKDKSKKAKEILTANTNTLNSNDVKELGIFAAPYLKEMSDKGNNKAEAALKSLLNGKKISNTELEILKTMGN